MTARRVEKKRQRHFADSQPQAQLSAAFPADENFVSCAIRDGHLPARLGHHNCQLKNALGCVSQLSENMFPTPGNPSCGAFLLLRNWLSRFPHGCQLQLRMPKFPQAQSGVGSHRAPLRSSSSAITCAWGDGRV